MCFALHGDYNFVLQTMQRSRDSKTFERVEQVYTSVQALAQQIDDLYDQGVEAFLLVAPSDECSTKTDTVHATWALACDFDAGVLPVLKNPLLQPSIIIGTSPGRFHAVWLMDESIEPDRADELLKALARRLNGDVAFARVNQMIRLPGFLNNKHGTEVSLLSASSFERSFDVDTLVKGFDLRLVDGIHQQIPQMHRTHQTVLGPHDTTEQIEDIRSALPYLKEYADDYDSWVKVMMQLVPLGDAGKALAREFSSLSSKFTEDSFHKKWQQLQKRPGHVATIFALAMENGWSNPGYRRSDRSAVTPMTDREFGAEVAREMSSDYAAIDYVEKGRRQAHFLHWNKQTYRQLSLYETRQAVDVAGQRVLAHLQENGAISSDTAKLFKGKLGIGLLMTISAVGAVILGYVEEAAALAFLYSIAEALEDKAMDRARGGLRALLKLVPETATIRRDGASVEVPAKDLAVGQLMLVRPGERIATDGIVRTGRSSLDTSAITGESIPVEVEPGDTVSAGAINTAGALEVETTAAGTDNSLTTIVELVEQAQAEKGDRARLADRIARPLVPGVMILAVLVGVLGSLLSGDPELWITRALVVLVAAYRRHNVGSLVLWLVVLLSLAAVAWDLVTGWSMWATTWAIPSICTFANLALVIVVRVVRMEPSEHIAKAALVMLFGLWTLPGPHQHWLMGH